MLQAEQIKSSMGNIQAVSYTSLWGRNAVTRRQNAAFSREQDTLSLLPEARHARRQTRFWTQRSRDLGVCVVLLIAGGIKVRVLFGTRVNSFPFCLGVARRLVSGGFFPISSF